MTEAPERDGPPKERPESGSALLASRVARMRYLDELSNSAIADRLGISRFRVARLLDHALQTGIVKITVSPRAAVDDERGSQLAERYRLSEALVLPIAEQDSEDPATVRAAVGALAAQYLCELASDGDTIGIAWGKTLDDVAAALEVQPRAPRCNVVQMVGNLSTIEGSMHAGNVLRRFAAALNGNALPLNAPLLLPTTDTADGVKVERSVARLLSQLDHLDMAVVGIGSWDPPSSRLREVLPETEIAALERRHPQADVCCIPFDRGGNQLVGEFVDRKIGVTYEQLKAIPRTIGVASGSEKAAAVRAALLAGILDVLVLDSEAAAHVLELS